MRSNLSKLESLKSLNPEELKRWLARLPQEEIERVHHSWEWNSRPNQRIPGTEGAESQRTDWIFWLCLAGRGWGKTRVGSEAVKQWAENPKERILMIAPTTADIRDTMLEGPSGLLSVYPEDQQPTYLPTRKLVVFPSGARGIMRSAEEPDRIRGTQFTKFWYDEIAASQYAQEAWDQVQFGFRLKTHNLQGLITTTPKPIPVLKTLVKDAATVISRGSSYENRNNLSETFYSKVIAPYEGTRMGRQEIHAELLEDVPGALWTRQLIEASRIQLIDVHWDLLIRIVVAIDPAVTNREDSDETGIVVVGLTASLHAVVLADLSLKGSPRQWAAVAVAAQKRYRADRIVGEVNNGGDLVEANVRTVDPLVPFQAVRASRGKYIRAEPVASLYEQGRVHHVADFDHDTKRDKLQILEDQMVSWTPRDPSPSPDRLDALVWGVAALLIDEEQGEAGFQFAQPYRISPV